MRGQNVLQEAKKKSIIAKFVAQLNDPLIYILLAAAAISLALRDNGDAMIILAVVFMNAIVGVIQEGKAERALQALKDMTSPHAVIRTNHGLEEILAADLLPGDIVCLEAGRQVPADLILKTAVNLKIEESALTGESVPVLKNTSKNNKAFMSTNVTYGRGEGVVVHIGMDTEIGKIAKMIQGYTTELTPLQKRLADLGKILSIVSVALCAVLFAIAVFQNRNIIEMLMTAISLAVAAVPEGLPAIVTIVLALSVSRMVKVNVIVKRLPSVETLGCVSVVCSDKTGTLTQNRMTVTRCYTNGRICRPEALSSTTDLHFLHGFTLCNDASLKDNQRMGDPTELALLDMTNLFHMHRESLEKKMPRVNEIPFDSNRKMMSTMHQSSAGKISYTKGSPDEILSKCRFYLSDNSVRPMTSSFAQQVRSKLSTFTQDALRVLALGMQLNASTLQEKDLVFVGFVGMEDPVRPQAKEAVQRFKEAGVDTIMITGDRIDTAYAIAKELGIAVNRTECITGEELERLDDSQLKTKLPYIHVLAHVSPEHKVRIVDAFKKAGKIVAMTGDGVNDAPSLKAADVGIAMGIAGTDVAKNAADLVLTDDNFATITKAIEQGRCIYDNIKKSVLFLLSSNFGEILTMLFAIAVGLASPLKSSHILWINLITDSLPALALGVDKLVRKDQMKHPPRSKKESLFAESGLFYTLFYGLLIAFISTAAFLQTPIHILSKNELPITIQGIQSLLSDSSLLNRCQTYAFTVLGISQLFHALGMRDVKCSIFKMNPLNNKLMIAAFILGLGLQMMVTEISYFVNLFGTVSLKMNEWLCLLSLAATPLLAHEILIITGKFIKK
jgi:Ca2+-transporting ATPase